MRTVIQTNTITVYKYDELSEKAKEHAYSKWLNGREYFWSFEANKCIESVEKLFGVKLRDWEYSSYRTNYGPIDWKYWDDDQLNLKGKRALTFAWNNWAVKLFDCKSYWKGNKKRKSKCQTDNYQCKLTGTWLDCEATDSLIKFMTYKDYDESKTVKELIKDSFNDLFQAIQKDCEYNESRECFEEEVENNEWEYTEDGEIYY